VDSQTLAHRRHPRAREQWPDSAAAGADALVLGRYRLRERLGAGGFGVVWSAHDELLHRDVAVKRVPLAPEEDTERASREALASARLAHPAIVALYEACAVEDAFYLISELVDGATLAELIAEDALTDEQILQVGIALCGALAHAHSRGVVHRDVKPQNVLVPHWPDVPAAVSEAFGGVAKLTDFGGARLSGQDVLTRTGDVLGTLAYMAPEQSNGQQVGEQADLYSLALVLYEALSGVNPVRGATPAETVRRIGRALPPLGRARRDMPRSLTRALDRALAPSANARGTLEELRLALEQGLEQTASQWPGGLAHASTDAGSEDVTAVEHGEQTRRERTRRLPRTRPIKQDRLPAPGRPGEREATHLQELHERSLLGPATVPAPAIVSAPPRRGLPRVLWLACALALAIWQAALGRPGVGLVALAALLPIVALPIGRRDRAGTGGWLLCALAPALGVIGLAGAFPALAGQSPRWRMRAALGALGYWWLVLAEPLLGRHLWLGAPTTTPARTVWESSLGSTSAHVIGPLLSLGVLLGAASWASAAALLPLLVRGRSAALDVLAATFWAAALAVAAPMLDDGLAAHAAQPSPRGAIVGAVLAGVLAVAARALRGPV
jgi:eukaryotic-like serine/threonine-protein kinase